jgi:hypothetical protein
MLWLKCANMDILFPHVVTKQSLHYGALKLDSVYLWSYYVYSSNLLIQN